LNAQLQTYHCQRCGYGWRSMRKTRPCKCPSCTTTEWDKPYERVPEGKQSIDTPRQVVERLMQGAGEILRTNSRCSVGKDLDNRYVVITPLMLPRWRATPDLYGVIVAHLDRDCTADDLGQALYGRRWLKRVT